MDLETRQSGGSRWPRIGFALGLVVCLGVTGILMFRYCGEVEVQFSSNPEPGEQRLLGEPAFPVSDTAVAFDVKACKAQCGSGPNSAKCKEECDKCKTLNASSSKTVYDVFCKGYPSVVCQYSKQYPGNDYTVEEHCGEHIIVSIHSRIYGEFTRTVNNVKECWTAMKSERNFKASDIECRNCQVESMTKKKALYNYTDENWTLGSCGPNNECVLKHSYDKGTKKPAPECAYKVEGYSHTFKMDCSKNPWVCDTSEYPPYD